jgi:hypothetical protein
MPDIAHSDEQRTGFSSYHDLRAIQRHVRPQQSKQRSSRHGDDGEHAPERQRCRLRTHAWTGRPNIFAQQRAFDAT